MLSSALEQVLKARDGPHELGSALAIAASEVLRKTANPRLKSPSWLISHFTWSQLAPPHEGVEMRFGEKSFVPVLGELVVPASPHQGDPSSPSAALAVALKQAFASTGDYGSALRVLATADAVDHPLQQRQPTRHLSSARVRCIILLCAFLFCLASLLNVLTAWYQVADENLARRRHGVRCPQAATGDRAAWKMQVLLKYHVLNLATCTKRSPLSLFIGDVYKFAR